MGILLSMSEAGAGSTTAETAEGDDVAELILERASALFADRGYKGCSMEKLAASLGATKPFVYYRYKDKADLLAAICERSLDLTDAVLSDALALDGTATQRLAAFSRDFAAMVIDRGSCVKVYQYEAAHLREADAARLAARRGAIEKRLRTLIAKGIEDGEFALDDPAIAASSINGMLVFITFWYNRRTPETRAQAIAKLQEFALRIVGAGHR